MLSWIYLLVALLSSLTIALKIMGSVMAGVLAGCLRAKLHVVVGWNSPSSYPGFSNLSKSLEGHWLTLLAFCLRLYRFLSRRAFTPFLDSPNPKAKTGRRKLWKAPWGDFVHENHPWFRNRFVLR